MIDVDAFLEHHGVKGMRWGIVNDVRDRIWKQRVNSKHGNKAVRIASSKKFAERLKSLVENPKYKGFDPDVAHNAWFNDPGHYTKGMKPPPYPKLLDEWEKDLKKHSDQSMQEAVKETHGVSPSRKFKAVADLTKPRMFGKAHIKIVPNKVEHDYLDEFLEHYGVKGMTRKSSLPEKLTRIARVASGTESTNKNFQKSLKEKLKKINDAIKEQQKKQKEYEDALKELDDSKDEEPDEASSEFIKKHAVTSVKELESTENEPSATSNE